MSQKNDTIPLVLALLVTAAVVAGGFWWLTNKSDFTLGDLSNSSPQNTKTNNRDTQNNSPPASNVDLNPHNTFSAPNNVPAAMAIAINGSTSMVQINKALKDSFESQFPGTQVIINGQGSDLGIKLLQEEDIDLAAISRPLKPQEQAQDLVAIPIVKDAIAIVVGVSNPFRRGLTDTQVRDIFQGKITDWSQVGGKSGTIRVINRPSISGTRQVIQQEALQGSDFGSGANFSTMERDATMPILRALDRDGISYATYAQVANQQTVRTVAINGLTPEANNYPYQRILYYVYQKPISPEVEAFLGYTLSAQGQKAIVTRQTIE